MYNMRIYQYADGIQVRLYSYLSGVHGYERPDPEKGCRYVRYYDDDFKEWAYKWCNPDKMWINLFTHEYERVPRISYPQDKERSARVSMNRTVNKVYHLARSNSWDWFFTLTFNPDLVDSFDYEVCSSALSKWLNNLRRSSPGLGYIVVPELHKSGRYHFHGLFFSCDGLKFTDSGHHTKSGDAIYNVSSYRLGFSTATRIKEPSKVSKYLCKYISKDLCSVAFGRKRYWASRNLCNVAPMEMILEGPHIKKLQEQLESDCLHRRIVQSGDNRQVIYYEMGGENGLLQYG